MPIDIFTPLFCLLCLFLLLSLLGLIFVLTLEGEKNTAQSQALDCPHIPFPTGTNEQKAGGQQVQWGGNAFPKRLPKAWASPSSLSLFVMKGRTHLAVPLQAPPATKSDPGSHPAKALLLLCTTVPRKHKSIQNVPWSKVGWNSGIHALLSSMHYHYFRGHSASADQHRGLSHPKAIQLTVPYGQISFST